MSSVRHAAAPVAAVDGVVAAPFLLRTQWFHSDVDLAWEQHRHVEHELLWSDGGALTLEADGRFWVVPSALGVWLPAGTEHAVRAARGAVVYATFFAADRGEVRDAEDDGLARVVVVPITRPLRELLLHNATSEAMSTAARLRLQRVIVDLLVPVDGATLDLPLPRAPELAALARRIVDDPADSRTTQEWARSLAMSPRTLTRGFLRETGVTFARWRILVRIRAALVELADGRSVSSVARRLGYANPSTFIELFRQVTGQTPAAYFGAAGAVTPGRCPTSSTGCQHSGTRAPIAWTVK